MQFTVQLFVREHPNGFFTLEVVGEPALCVYTPDLDRGREELALMLTDQLERAHPGRLWRYVTPADLTLHAVEVPEALPVYGREGLSCLPTKISILSARDRKWLQLWAIRWGARQWAPRRALVGADGEEELERAVAAMMESVLASTPAGAQVERRWIGEERVEPLTLDVEIAAPMAFTGPQRGALSLPAPAPPDEAEGEADEEKQQAGKKKRPPTPTFKRIGVDLVAQAKAGDLEMAHGRGEAVDDLYRRVTAAGGTSVVVVAPSAAGKTAVLNALVARLIDEAGQAERPVWFVDASRLIAGEDGFGGWQRQVLDIAEEAAAADVIWYVGDPLALLDAGRSAQSDQNVAMMLKPHLTGGRLTLVAEATPAAWAQLELRDVGFARAFSPWILEPPAPPEARAILEAVAADLAATYEITVSPAGLSAIEGLCARFRGDDSPLGTAIHFLRRLVDEADSHRAAALIGEAAPAPVTLDRGAVVARFCAETGMPDFLIRDDLPLDTDEIERRLGQRIIGQAGAIRRMADLVAVMKAGLSDLSRPLGSFLFVGPTGVGKTETAKALAALLFGSADRMLRFDMSELSAPSSVHRFIGGDGEEGRLISEIRQQPFCVLLLDEIEKAHPAIFDVLLQVLGEARLTDAAGRTASFCNAVVLMTSNLGVETLRNGVGFGGGEDEAAFEAHFRSEAARFFRPELFNRIDHVVPFSPLQAEAIEAITHREISKLEAREGLRQRGIRLRVPDEIRRWLAARGVAPRYGARPLKRLIEQRMVGPLAQVLSTQGDASHQVITVEVDPQDGDRLSFSRAEGQGASAEAGARRALLALVKEIALIRDQVARWQRSELATRRRQHLRLMDRLSRERHFWHDAGRAEALTRGMAPDREILDGFEALMGRVEALEELAYEQLYDRRLDGVELLEPELEGALSALGDLELKLYDRDFSSPDGGVIYLQIPTTSPVALKRLMQVYCRLAVLWGWRITCSQQDLEAPAPPEPKPTEEEDEVVESRRPRRGRRRGPSAPPPNPAWTEVARFDGAKHTFSAEGARALRDEIEATWLASRSQQRQILALRVEGPHVCLLSAETGVYTYLAESGATPEEVTLVYVDSPALLDVDKLGPRWQHTRRRVMHEGRGLIEDLPLALRLPIPPRLERPWRRILMAAMYDHVFGPGQAALFKRRSGRGAEEAER